MNPKLASATAIAVALILGMFYYTAQVNKQNSIERQQSLEMEQENKEYIAKRKKECREIFEKEKSLYSNVDNYGYIDVYDPVSNLRKSRNDTCEIIYIDEDGEYYRKYY